MNRFGLALLLLVLAGCAAPPRDTVPRQTDPSAPPARSRPAAPAPPVAPSSGVIATAETFLGVPYRYGGLSREGLDCSGLVYTVYRKHGIQLPRTSSQQAKVGEAISRESLRAGDLVFFGNSRGRVNHVGIYAGQGRFIHASTSRRAVRYDSLTQSYFRDHFVGARRLATVAAAAR